VTCPKKNSTHDRVRTGVGARRNRRLSPLDHSVPQLRLITEILQNVLKTTVERNILKKIFFIANYYFILYFQTLLVS